jgi:heterotetrameric sarcosine oxidase gamma subunit
MTCHPPEWDNMMAGIDASSCTDVTSVWAALLVAGPMTRQVMRKLTSLNMSDAALPDGACGQASLAHVHAIVLRRDLDDIPAVQVLVSREYAESVYEALLHAGKEFLIQPFGLEALKELRF